MGQNQKEFDYTALYRGIPAPRAREPLKKRQTGSKGRIKKKAIAVPRDAFRAFKHPRNTFPTSMNTYQTTTEKLIFDL